MASASFTVQQAYQTLEQQQLISADQPRSGYFLAPREA